MRSTAAESLRLKGKGFFVYNKCKQDCAAQAAAQSFPVMKRRCGK